MVKTVILYNEHLDNSLCSPTVTFSDDRGHYVHWILPEYMETEDAYKIIPDMVNEIVSKHQTVKGIKAFLYDR